MTKKSLKVFTKMLFKEKKDTAQLGGNLGSTNIDRKLLDLLYNNFGFRSFLDIGCGTGGMVFNAIDIGFHANGIEGDPCSIPKDCPLIHCVDYRYGHSILKSQFDIGYSCEFLEHVPKSCINNYMKDMCLCQNLIITAAPPGWGGIGHVNEQEPDYWINIFRKYGFNYMEEQTQQIRSCSELTFKGTIRSSKKQFIRNRGLFFKKATI